LHLPDRWRCSLYRDPDESVEDAIKPEAIQQKMQKIVTQAGDYDVLDLRVYRVHMRIVDDYRVGRVVFAGDAAHVNSPSGGMGMNGGVHDAFALTEEINAIFNGAALDRLDAYTKQRLPIAKSEIMAQADKNRRRMQERDPVKRREIFKQLQRIASSDDLARAYLLNSSMITGLKRAKAIVAS
jgi:3-(3-hydroxy-phenyl)propionate hydroxylase